MNDIPGLNLNVQQILEMYVAFQIFSAFVQSLPIPVEGGNVFYASFYKFINLIAADFKGFVSKIPAFPKDQQPPAEPAPKEQA